MAVAGPGEHMGPNRMVVSIAVALGAFAAAGVLFTAVPQDTSASIAIGLLLFLGFAVMFANLRRR